MTIKGMRDFQNVCMRYLRDWYEEYRDKRLTEDEVFIVWSCKTLQNYKCLASTTVSGDGIYAEYTYNGDNEELYEDVYVKESNHCLKVR